MIIHGIEVKGSEVDRHTRCKHYKTERDIVAIKFACCKTYYPCYQCHDEQADHPIIPWTKESFQEKAILCGNCGYELTINEYLGAEWSCPRCNEGFNPGCGNHLSLYFQL
ncbi:MAG TPA: CHY zinc finger protein [Bacillales bacterium]|nr:CHY zinc finger protein [Bacillales bacterium]